jgi:GNAT superfamily N-acetyltransferase
LTDTVTSKPDGLRVETGIRATPGKLNGVLVVRRRTDGDLQALEQLAARVRAADDYPTFLPGDDYHRFLTRPVALEAWVSVWNERICGHVALNAQSSPGAMWVLRDAGIVGSVGAVARLLVDPDVRRRGVARALLQTARSAAVAHQRIPVLEVIESSHPAIALYRDAGWVELGRASLSLPDGRELPELVFATDEWIQPAVAGAATRVLTRRYRVADGARSVRVVRK